MALGKATGNSWGFRYLHSFIHPCISFISFVSFVWFSSFISFLSFMYFMHFICSRVYSFTGSGSYPFTCFIRSFIHPFFCSFVCSVILSFIRSFIHSFIIYFCKRFLFAMLCHFGGMSTLFHLTTSTFVASASHRYSYRLLISDRLSSFSKLPPRSGRTQSGIFCS